MTEVDECIGLKVPFTLEVWDCLRRVLIIVGVFIFIRIPFPFLVTGPDFIGIISAQVGFSSGAGRHRGAPDSMTF